MNGRRLPGSGDPDDADDPVGARHDRSCHLPLLRREPRLLDGLSGKVRRACSAPAFDEGERRALDSDQLRRRVEGRPAGLRSGANPLDFLETCEATSELADPFGVRAADVRLGPRHDEVGLGERGPRRGQSLRAEHPPGDPEEVGAGGSPGERAMEQGLQLATAEPVLGGAGAPVVPELGEVDVLLALPGLPRRGLGRAPAFRAPVGDPREHLEAALRELAEGGAGDALDLGHALGGRLPLDAERARELGAQVRLVEVAGGEPVGAEDRVAVERTPLAVRRAARHVGHDHVRVEVRVLGAARAVLVGGGDEAGGVLALDAVLAATGDAGLVLEVGERGLPGGDVGRVDGETRLLVAEGVEQAHALGDGEDEVEAGDRAERLRLDPPLAGFGVDPLDRDLPLLRSLAQALAARRVDAADELRELAVLDNALEPEQRGAAAGPDAG